MIHALSPLSWLVVAIMVTAIAAAFGKRFLATGALLVANVAIFFVQLVVPEVQSELSLYPANLLALEPVGFLQLFTSMFSHGGVFHILGNMIFLWAFGMPFEERIGPRRFMALYLAAGLVGSLAQAWFMVHEGAAYFPMLGASGAVFGIMCAFAAKYPNQVVGVPVPLFVLLIRIPMRVVYGALLWLAIELVRIVPLALRAESTNVGHFAHLAGGAAGVLLAVTALRHVDLRPGKGPIAIDLVALGDFAHDGPTKTVLAHMRQNHDEPEVFQAWLDRFFRTATCPTCKHRVMPKHRGEVVCTQGHAFDVRQDKRTGLQPLAKA